MQQHNEISMIPTTDADAHARIAEETLKTLQSIERQNKKQTAYLRICASGTIVSAVLVIVALIAGFMVYQRVETAMETTLEALDAFSTQMSVLDLDEMSNAVGDMLENIDGFVSESREGVTAANEAMNAINFEKLNEAIEDLQAVIEPMAKFFKR